MRAPPTLMVLLTVLIGAGLWLVLGERHGTPSRQPSSGRAETGRAAVTPDPATWRPAATREATAASLASLAESLRKIPAAEAVALIRELLATGVDRDTGLGFVIGADRRLTAWPTLRVFLLDQLATIDPAAAAEISHSILVTPTTPDEWALALRNIGHTGTSAEDREFLRAKTEELIRNPAWQASPTVGYLNAFDTLVHVGAVESAPLLSDLVRKTDRKDLAHAAFLTIDRLTQSNPVAMLGWLAADEELFRSRPEMVAQQFARADLRDAAQRELLASYLLDPRRSRTELQTFAGSFPNQNQFVSYNLLTAPAPQVANLAERDRAALEVLENWLEDAAFRDLRPVLLEARGRLATFVHPPPPTRHE